MKRSNRLFLLVGIILAVVAAAGIILITGQRQPTRPGETPAAEVDVVIAAAELPLGKVIEAADLGTRKVPEAQAPLNAVMNRDELIGLTVRQAVSQGQIITRAHISSAGLTLEPEALQRALTEGFRAMAVQVDQVTGVGTLIRPGDRVDVVITVSDSGGKNPITVEQAPTREGTPPVAIRNFRTIDDLLNNTTTKVLVENVQVLGTLLPPAPEEQGQQAPASPAPGQTDGQTDGGTGLTGQQQIAILGLLPQQVELVRFAQIDGELSLVLRDTEDNDTPPVTTTGITLRQLYDQYGVLPPNINVITIP